MNDGADSMISERHSARLSARLALVFSCVGHSFSHLLMLLYPTVVLSLEVAWDLPFDQLIALMLIGQILFGAMAVPAGWLGDRWSAPGMMVVFFIGTGGACVMTGFADTPFEIGLGIGVMGLFAAIYHPVGIAWVTRNPENRGKALGINGVFGALGTAGGAAVAGTLATVLDWRWAFYVPGAICVLVGFGLLACLMLGLLVDQRETARSAPAESSRGDMLRAVLVLMFTIALSGMIYQATSFAMPKLFDTRLNGWVETSAAIGGLVSGIYVVSAAAQVLGGWLADRYDTRRVYAICWAVQVPFLILAAALVGPILLPVAAIMVLGNTTAVPAENSLFARYTPPAWRGTAFGVKFLVSLGVSAISVPLVGEMFRLSGDFANLLILLGVFAGTAFAIALLLPAPRTGGDPLAQPAE
jgi:MFS family permease